jgi:iron(III) transport system ATP-binding protein
MLKVEGVSASFGPVSVLQDVSLQVSEGEVVCLLGASGSGKSTLLRIIAGIERPTRGRVRIGGVEVAGPGVFVEPEDRRVGMVFQDYALFPHLTVAENAVFGVRKSAHSAAEILERFGLSKYAYAYPHMLSGGEQQRLALARAMAPQPRILLMDEPFCSLDTRLREEVRRYTLDFLRASRTTTVIVTHDPEEALRVADRIALLEAGRLLQYATPHEIYTHPNCSAVAQFFEYVTAPPAAAQRHGPRDVPLTAKEFS